MPTGGLIELEIQVITSALLAQLRDALSSTERIIKEHDNCSLSQSVLLPEGRVADCSGG